MSKGAVAQSAKKKGHASSAFAPNGDLAVAKHAKCAHPTGVAAGPSHASSVALKETPDRFDAAFAQCRGRMLDIPEDELLTLNIDVSGAIGVAAKALPRIAKVRDALAQMPELDIAHVDALPEVLDALTKAQAGFVGGAPLKAPEVDPLYAEGLSLRNVFLADARLLVQRGLLDASRIASLTGSIGWRNVGTDLLWLSEAVVPGSEAATRTTITAKEHERARIVGRALLAAAAPGDADRGASDSPASMRQRAFTLFVRDYETVRLALGWIRRNHGDADVIAPSIYTARTPRGKATNGTDGATPTPPSPPAPPAAAAGTEHLDGGDHGAALHGMKSTPANGASDVHVVPPQAAVPPGHAGGSPFAS